MDYFDGVANFDRGAMFRNEVLAEHDAAAQVAAEGAQRADGFHRIGAGGGGRVDGSDDAAVTRFGDAENGGADADAAPGVLGPGGRAGEHEIGAEARHRDRHREARVEVGEGCGGGEQHWVAVGEADGFAWAGVGRVYWAGARVGKVGEAALGAQGGAEPGGGFVAGVERRHGVAPDRYLAAGGRGGRRREAERGVVRRGERNGAGGRRPGVQPGHGDDFALREHGAGVIGDQPAPVAGEPARVHAGGSLGFAAQAFDRVDVDFGEVRRVHAGALGARR